MCCLVGNPLPGGKASRLRVVLIMRAANPAASVGIGAWGDILLVALLFVGHSLRRKREQLRVGPPAMLLFISQPSLHLPVQPALPIACSMVGGESDLVCSWREQHGWFFLFRPSINGYIMNIDLPVNVSVQHPSASCLVFPLVNVALHLAAQPAGFMAPAGGGHWNVATAHFGFFLLSFF